jgi:phospholipid/cholesterol/gamma-HCH transport system permease protein
MTGFFAWMGRGTLSGLDEMGRMALLFRDACAWSVRPPFRLRLILRQMEFVGASSLFVVGLTSLFTGMVLALQTYHAFRLFSAENLVGAVVALSMARELGPVITALMVTGRAGSAMAAEIGTMRVTEQVDALTVMAVPPVQYLVAPRLIAGFVMLPLLAALADLIGVAGGYLVGVRMLGINSGLFLGKIYEMVEIGDILNGMGKAAVFGVILTLIGCFKGYTTSGGAEGVGRATTAAVVWASVAILAADYVMTALTL